MRQNFSPKSFFFCQKFGLLIYFDIPLSIEARHSAKPYKILIYKYMKERGLVLCASCRNKQKRDGLKKEEYYCSVVDGIVPNGIITSSTEALTCIDKGLFNDIK